MKKLLALVLALLIPLAAVSAVAEQWTGYYECVSGGVSGFDPMGTLLIVNDEEGDRYRLEGSVSLVTDFTIYSIGDKYADTLYVTGTMSELGDDYSNIEGIYLAGTMVKSGNYIYFTVVHSNGKEVLPGDVFTFVKA